MEATWAAAPGAENRAAPVVAGLHRAVDMPRTAAVAAADAEVASLVAGRELDAVVALQAGVSPYKVRAAAVTGTEAVVRMDAAEAAAYTVVLRGIEEAVGRTGGAGSNTAGTAVRDPAGAGSAVRDPVGAGSAAQGPALDRVPPARSRCLRR